MANGIEPEAAKESRPGSQHAHDASSGVRPAIPPRVDAPEFHLRPSDLAAAEALGRDCGVGPAVGQILLNRGYRDPEEARAFLDPTLAGLSSPVDMADRDAASERIAAAIRGKERIVVFGDYDVDGTTSAAILSDIIEALGGEVIALCANRFAGGYGLSAEGLKRCLDLAPGLLITCDCGSSDHERIADAQRQGVDVIVVDHHLVPEDPLPAVAFLNPHRPECGFAYKGLASAGLAFSVGAALRSALDVNLDVRPWLDLVALGTVADVAPLDGDNRRLVRAGLKQLASSSARPGVAALRNWAKIPARVRLTATDISFRFAPRLNAAGRLGLPEVALALLRARTTESAFALAQQLHELNEKRKEMSGRIAEEAIRQTVEVYGEEPQHGIVVAGDDWHRGVVGITAARVAEHFHVPAVVIAFDGDVGHGSGRTVSDLDLHAALGECASLLDGWGGHRAAVGLNLRKDRLDALRAAFAEATTYEEPPSRPPLEIEVELNDSFSTPTAQEMERLEPLGQKNAIPSFLATAQVEKTKAVGVDGRHLALQIKIADRSLRGFAPNMGDRPVQVGQHLTVIGELRPDHWRGGDHLEFLIRQLW